MWRIDLNVLYVLRDDVDAESGSALTAIHKRYKRGAYGLKMFCDRDDCILSVLVKLRKSKDVDEMIMGS